MQYKFKNLDTTVARLLTKSRASRVLDDVPIHPGKHSAFNVGFMRFEGRVS